ncbi:MAG: DNA topoisomerase 3 [Selenomonadaceae bacterium]|nr:DNA topoisomerase 3 [Selenomonadaceae bacterium]
MRLYIAEKPSMGREIAKCLKTPHDTGNKGYIATGEGVVTWLYGHVLRQAEPEEYDPKYKNWNILDLPIVPSNWKMIIDPKANQQFYIVKRLISEADEIVHAGDPDREGQLLVDEVLDYVGNKKPVKRILLNALDARSIKSANADLRDNADFFNLKQSALARSRADWLIGMNLSRAYTLAARRAGYKRLVLPIGRVKTPTLALVVRREREIENFKPTDYYLIRADFKHENGDFTAQWVPKIDKSNKQYFDDSKRLINKDFADEMLKKFKVKPHDGKVSLYETKEKKDWQPLPFSLSALQVMAGKQLGYAPQKILDTAQSLYEKKLTTYPRSDCSYLPPNQFKDAQIILDNLAKVNNQKFSNWATNANSTMKSRAWNKSKITAHHAIIPTTKQAPLESLSDIERNIYLLIARQYIAQFYPEFIYDETTVNVDYKDETFTVKGKVTKQLGWKELFANWQNVKTNEDEVEMMLPKMSKGDSVEYQKGSALKKTTKPPPRFTPATLIQGMKEIHKYVKSEAAKKQLKDVYGIGTEATRATIIDDLIKRQFLTTTGKAKVLKPTEQAYLLVDALPDEMTYPDATAVWEDKLHSMSEGEGTLQEFLKGQVKFTEELCEKATQCEIKTAPPSEGTEYKPVVSDIKCPLCKRGFMVKRRRRSDNNEFWGCSNYPKCKMACNDKEGQPNLEEAMMRLQKQQERGYVNARSEN